MILAAQLTMFNIYHVTDTIKRDLHILLHLIHAEEEETKAPGIEVTYSSLW